MSKISFRFYKDHEVRAIWDEENSKWWFSVQDVVGAINDQSDYKKNRNYWKYLKTKLRKEGNELVSATNQLKLRAADGKRYDTDVLDAEGIRLLAKYTNNQRAMDFLDWFTYSDNTIDGQSRKKAYTLWESNLVADKDVGKVKALQQIHAYLFGGAEYLHDNLKTIEQMPETTFDEIVDKYVEMNVAHPFMEGNGRSTRIWLDLIFKKQLKMCVDWSKIDKKDYLDAMIASHMDSTRIRELLKQAMTDKIDDREIFMKGIDYSYYYEQEE